MQDYVVKATAGAGQIRAFAAHSTHLVEEARRRHNTLPTASAALGRVLTAAAMIGTGLKDQENVTIRVVGDGPLGAILAVADAAGKVRGYVQNPLTHLPSKSFGKLDVGKAVGSIGMLYVTKDLGMKEPYTGSVPLVSGEIAEDLTHYFLESEQIPSAVALGVLVNVDNSILAAGGYILQLLPGATIETSSLLEERIKAQDSISRQIEAGKTPEIILTELLEGFDLQIHGRQPISFHCGCSKDRLAEILISLGPDELQAMVEEEQKATIRCHFCNTEYRFSKEELVMLLKQARHNDNN